MSTDSCLVPQDDNTAAAAPSLSPFITIDVSNGETHEITSEEVSIFRMVFSGRRRW